MDATATAARGRFEAIVFDWDAVASPEQAVQDDRRDGRIGRLVEEACAHGLELVLVSAAALEHLDNRLAARPSGPGSLMLVADGDRRAYIVERDGPRPASSNSDSPPSILARLWQHGVAPEQVLCSGGGTRALALLLEDQIARRSSGELPAASDDPAWTVTVAGSDAQLERVHESLLTIADGRLGTRGSAITGVAGGEPAVLMAGVYTRTGAEAHLLNGPRWNELALDPQAAGQLHRVLDLRTGTLYQRAVAAGGGVQALMFCSLARPGLAVMRACGPIRRSEPLGPLVPPPEVTCEQGEHLGTDWLLARGRPGSIVAAAHDRVKAGTDELDAGESADRVLDRIAAYEGVAQGVADARIAARRVQEARGVGFDALLSEQRRAWAHRWSEADIGIEGDPELQQAIRFALFHLIASTAEEGEAAVGARGLSGRAYRGHVFWDSDVFMLPFLAATHPRSARAMLEYRLRRLPEALRAARQQGHEGARFPWESAWSGREVAPTELHDARGDAVPVLTGALEEHIVADIAWAAGTYIDWTADRQFAAGPGQELLMQTARWWASRVELDRDGRAHIRGVIGPDEYHERVDDNAYTNVMARWNLKRAADLGSGAVGESERRHWLELATALVDGYDPETGIYEQFAGFHALEPLLIAELAPRRPVDANMLLGGERLQAAQVIKQADVLMLHYLVPEEAEAGSLEANLDFYEPRTAHGSTLSPGVHAALLARAGRLEQALEMLRLTARIDLDDIGHMTAGGLHLAAMGSAWRALAFGVAGIRPGGDALAIDPVLPSTWASLEVPVRFHGRRVHIRISADAVQLSAEAPVAAVVGGVERVELRPSPLTVELPRADERRRP